MSVQNPARPGTRRVGYVVAILVNALLLWLVNVSPGWQAAAFLTANAAQIIPVLNASIVVSIAANLLYLVHDPPGFKALGDLVTTGVALVVLITMWQVFPFSTSAGWTALLQIGLGLATFGCAIGVAVAAVTLARNGRVAHTRR